MAYSILDNCIGCHACQALCPAQAITGEKKARHTIDPDACIECKACGRICPSASVTDHFGLVIQRVPKKEWPQPLFNLDLCMSCTICMDSCPAGVISQHLQKVGSKHLFPVLKNETGCIACGFCAQDCPVDAIEMVPRNERDADEKESGKGREAAA